MIFECISFCGEIFVNNMRNQTKPNKKRQNAKKQPIALKQTEKTDANIRQSSKNYELTKKKKEKTKKIGSFFLFIGLCVFVSQQKMTIKASVLTELLVVVSVCFLDVSNLTSNCFFSVVGASRAEQLLVCASVFFCWHGDFTVYFVFILKEYANLHKIKPSLSKLNPKFPLPYIEHRHTHAART